MKKSDWSGQYYGRPDKILWYIFCDDFFLSTHFQFKKDCNSSGSWVYWTQSAKLAAASSWTQASFTTLAVPSGATNISVGMGIAGVGSITMDDFGLYLTS
jgi:hypothetical protein